jgi:hypothetical protein
MMLALCHSSPQRKARWQQTRGLWTPAYEVNAHLVGCFLGCVAVGTVDESWQLWLQHSNNLQPMSGCHMGYVCWQRDQEH